MSNHRFLSSLIPCRCRLIAAPAIALLVDGYQCRTVAEPEGRSQSTVVGVNQTAARFRPIDP
jgi:transposase